MNPDGTGQDRFTTIISTVCYNFKSLFALTYPNCNAFSIKDFDYRFIVVPRTHFRRKNIQMIITTVQDRLISKLCAKYFCMRL